MRALVDAAERLHFQRYGTTGDVVLAPGRVNLIGEHTDYNDGFVLPMAIDRYTVVVVSPADDDTIRVYSAAFDEEATFSLDAGDRADAQQWSSYARGMGLALRDRRIAIPGCRLTVLTDVPLGSGLSSSASFEIAVGQAYLLAANDVLDPKALAFAGQESEHRYVGIRCGIMDQLTVACGETAHALLIDCRSLDIRPVPLPQTSAVLVCDSLLRHQLSTSAYNDRRAECERAVAVLARRRDGVRALRDVDGALLESARTELDDVAYRRAKHVVEENERTLAGANALERRDVGALGNLMVQSHESLRSLYEVSTPELDELVALARDVPGVAGARMTGGGFGGSIVVLARRDAVDDVRRRLQSAYYEPRGEGTAVIVVEPTSGVRLVSKA